jgi:hypothetical protein
MQRRKWFHDRVWHRRVVVSVRRELQSGDRRYVVHGRRDCEQRRLPGHWRRYERRRRGE